MRAARPREAPVSHANVGACTHKQNAHIHAHPIRREDEGRGGRVQRMRHGQGAAAPGARASATSAAPHPPAAPASAAVVWVHCALESIAYTVQRRVKVHCLGLRVRVPRMPHVWRV